MIQSQNNSNFEFVDDLNGTIREISRGHCTGSGTIDRYQTRHQSPIINASKNEDANYKKHMVNSNIELKNDNTSQTGLDF